MLITTTLLRPLEHSALHKDEMPRKACGGSALIKYTWMQDGVLPGMVKNRYSTYSTGVGKKIRDGKVTGHSTCHFH